MARELSYKLGRYKITEAFGGGLWWESHHGVGSLKKGKCTIEGSILILGPSEIEEPGFLKREFVEHLDKLPNWDKTKYYCLSHSIHKCRTEGKISLKNKTDDRVVVAQNAVKVAISDPVEHKEIINKQPDARKEFVYFSGKISNLWDFLKQLSNKSSR
jgi:hypothetical protein